MSYRTKFIRREIKERRVKRIRTARHLTLRWEILLECGHILSTAFNRGKKVRRPVCAECNQIAADLGRAKRLTNDL